MKLAGTIKKKMTDGIAIGTTVTLADIGVTEGLGLAGLDFVWIDMEHSTLGKIEVCGHIIAAKASQIASFVRVPWNDPVQMKPILDMGPDGLIVPQIRSLQEAKNAIAACFYPPKGVRGFGPLRASGYGTYNITESLPEDYKPTLLFLQVEHVDCVECIDDILALEGVDGLIFGPMDLSASIGKLGKMDDPELNQIMDDLSHKIIQSGKIEFDRCIATPDLMPLVGRLGKILGPRNLMPNPKVGTVTMDVKAAVTAAKGGEVQFKVEKAGVIHAGIGKVSFTEEMLAQNVRAFVDAVSRARPAGAKGTYLKKVSLSSTMGPGVSLDLASATAR